MMEVKQTVHEKFNKKRRFLFFNKYKRPSLFGIVKFCKIELNKVATGRFTVELKYFIFSVE